MGRTVSIMKAFIATLPPGADRAAYEKALKRLREGLKMKDSEGNADPRIIDDFYWFYSHDRDAAKAHTKPDDNHAKTSKPGWGKDQVIQVNMALFHYIDGKYCPLANQGEKQEWMNALLGIALIHEGIHVDQSGDIDSKSNRCEAWMITYNLFSEFVWQDSCLSQEWNRRKAAVFKKVNQNCGS